jgi:hypothetical protein
MEEVGELLARQAGVISRSQVLALGFAPHDVRRRLRRREWAPVHDGVYVNHTGAPTWLQRCWAAVLFAWPAALCHQSALAGASPGRREADNAAPIHIAIDRDRTVRPPVGVVVTAWRT